jgi:hypothetical protein
MGLLAFLVKPALYFVAFAIAHAAFKAYAPHLSMGGKPLGKWALIILAGFLRILVGVPGGLLAATVATTASIPLFAAIVVPLGFVLWLGCAKLAFPRTPWSRLLVFALAAEVVVGAIDIWAMYELSTISFC